MVMSSADSAAALMPVPANADAMVAIVSAMSFVENGEEANENEIRQGYLLAFAS